MKKIMLTFFISFTVLALIPQAVDAKGGGKRFGGGQSVGKQRDTSTSQKETVPPQKSKSTEYSINIPIRSSSGSSSSTSAQSGQVPVAATTPVAAQAAATSAANSANNSTTSPAPYTSSSSLIGSSLSVTVILGLIAIVIFFIIKTFRSL